MDKRRGEGRYYDPFFDEQRRGNAIVLNAVEKGYTPVKGKDYWTPDELAEMDRRTESVIDEKIDERLDESGAIRIDDVVTADSANPPSGAAVYAHVAQEIANVATVQIDGTVTQAGANPVSGAAVYDFTAQEITAGDVKPVSSAAVTGYAMPLTGIVATDTDPGVGAEVDYADGTVVLVYE